MDQATALAALKIDLKTVVSLLTDEELTRALDRASQETWSLEKITNGFREYWYIQRGRRHSLEMLCLNFAQKFKVNTFHLDQKWSHFWEMVKQLDKDFLAAIANNPDEFADSFIDSLTDEEKMSYFGYVIEPGFEYTPDGEEVTPHKHVRKRR